MTRRGTLTLAAMLLAGIVAVVPVARARIAEHADVWNGAEINWRDIKSGIYESSQTGKPVVMVFHATWCSACKKYRAVFRDPGVVAASSHFVMILIDVDADKIANGAFAPDGTYVPRTLFLDSDGNVRTEFRGAGDPKYPHSINVDGPDELRALMTKAGAALRPAEKKADDRT
ncbi:MAG: thioredoxin family protein [Hyphomicrobium sp.]